MASRSLALALHALLLTYAIYDLIDRWSRYAEQEGALPFTLLGLRCVLSGLAVVGWLWCVARGDRREPDSRMIRTLVYCAAAGLVVATLAHPLLPRLDASWLSRSIFFCVVLAAQCLWLVWIYRPRAVLAAGLVRADTVAANVLATVVILELLISLLGWIRPSPLLSGRSVDDLLRAKRRPPGAAFFDRRLNSGGFADDEFFVAEERDLVIAVLADSFGLGIVPIDYNFITVAENVIRNRFEERYARVALHNFGVPAIGLTEYAVLLEEEVVHTAPQLVVVATFVGNDVLGGVIWGEVEERRHALQRWQLWTTAERLLRLYGGATDEDRQRLIQIGRAEEPGEIPAHIHDASLESPIFSEEQFHWIEVRRARVTRPDLRDVAGKWDAYMKALEYFRRRLGDRLAVVIIPDEFQVNDRLWSTLVEATEGSNEMDRFAPQRRILAFCERAEIPCLDLLPSLKRAERDGHTYHLRDTHWNARGNAVAGEAMGEFIADVVEARPASRTPGPSPSTSQPRS
ncbi:MAG: hypothetical protein JRG94_15320 [Deltaproteobacteria bacterium]|nr:hypothetical protein [Deltaproteobacteria bacterium]